MNYPGEIKDCFNKNKAFIRSIKQVNETQSAVRRVYTLPPFRSLLMSGLVALGRPHSVINNPRMINFHPNFLYQPLGSCCHYKDLFHKFSTEGDKVIDMIECSLVFLRDRRCFHCIFQRTFLIYWISLFISQDSVKLECNYKFCHVAHFL